VFTHANIRPIKVNKHFSLNVNTHTYTQLIRIITVDSHIRDLT
jgi:hypothetical protein